MTNKILKFVLVKNTLPTAKEPYNGQFVSNGTTALDAFCEKICKGRTNIDAPTLKLILRTAFTFIAEDMAENVFRYQTGLLTFEPAIEGSLPSMDAPLTDENPLVVAVRLAADFAREIAAAVPTRDSDDAISVKIDDVLDVEAEKYHQVTGGKRFQLTGKNISASGDGEGVEVAGPDGIAHACTVVEEDGMGQRIVAEAPSDADPGKGAILLTTRGYATPDAEPIMVKKQVTVIKSATPIDPTAPYLTGYKVDGQPVSKIPAGACFTVLGERIEAFNCSTGTSKAMMTFTAGARAGTTMDLGYTGSSCSPRYDTDFGGVYIATPNVELAAGEKGTLTLEIDGKKSNALAFMVG